MVGYHRDELEDYDEYDYEVEAQEEEEEEYEEEEDPKPTKEELEYLELRQQLKEVIRKQMKKENSSSLSNRQDTQNKLPNDSFGSFFGPAKPVIAHRVIQESKSFLENQHLAAKVLNSQHSVNKKTSTPATVDSKPGVRNLVPKVLNEQKIKAQKLKNTRDYSSYYLIVRYLKLWQRNLLFEVGLFPVLRFDQLKYHPRVNNHVKFLVRYDDACSYVHRAVMF